MDNKKRAIMVPVLTLAVCAIAMVGLGFAISTNVISNSNAVESMMIDLDTSGSDLKNQSKPDDSPVNNIFGISVSTTKNNTITTTVTGGCAYLKVFGNIQDVDLKVKGTTIPSNLKITFSIYGVNGSYVKDGSSTSQSVEIDGTTSEKKFSNTITSDTVYFVEISSITITGESNKDITFSHDGTRNPTITGGQDYLTNLPDGLSLTFEFTASPHVTGP